jgi:TatD DNase family protein
VYGIIDLMKYIDIHCHLDFPDYDSDREEVIKKIQEAEAGIINVGTDAKTSRSSVDLAHKYPEMWATVAIHPNHTNEPFDFGVIEKLAQDPRVVAIGECGLDCFRSQPEDLDRQKEVFIQHIELANSVKKPLMLHIRNGKDGKNMYQEAIKVLKKHAKVPANFHFFAGSLDDLKSILEIGGTVSFTGVLTFTKDYDEVVKNVPMDKFMTETDAPYASPIPFRGKRNEPAHVREVVKAIARIKGETEEKVAQQSVDNARRVFGI